MNRAWWSFMYCMYLHVRSLKCASCGSCKCFRSEATLFGCLKDSKIQPGQKLFGLLKSHRISTGYALGSDPWISSPQAASNCHAGGIGKADSESSGQPDDPWGMHQASCHLLRFDMVQLAPCHHVLQIWDGLCNLSQELLDYLKQFDMGGKGALSEEELQEVMRGRIGLGTAEKVGGEGINGCLAAWWSLFAHRSHVLSGSNRSRWSQHAETPKPYHTRVETRRNT